MKKKLLTKKMWLATSQEIVTLDDIIDCSYIFLKNPKEWHPATCTNKLNITKYFVINNKSVNTYGKKHPIKILLQQMTDKSEIQKNSCIMFEKATVLDNLCIVSTIHLPTNVMFREGYTTQELALIFGKTFIKSLPDNEITFFKILLT